MNCVYRSTASAGIFFLYSIEPSLQFIECVPISATLTLVSGVSSSRRPREQKRMLPPIAARRNFCVHILVSSHRPEPTLGPRILEEKSRSADRAAQRRDRRRLGPAGKLGAPGVAQS